MQVCVVTVIVDTDVYSKSIEIQPAIYILRMFLNLNITSKDL